MNFRRLTFTLAAAGVLLLPAVSLAQRSDSAMSGSSSSSGLFGNRNLGQGVGGRNDSNFQGTPGNMVEQAQAGAGEVSGGERFVRDNRQPGQFVGADSGDTTNFFGQTNGGGQFGSGLEQLLRNRGQGFQGNQNQGSSRTPLRPRLSLGFSYDGPAETRITGNLQTLLAKLPSLEVLSPVTVAIEDRTVVLRGRVASEHDREMAAQIVMLEPGVSRVRNELLVGTGSATPRPAAKQLPLIEPAAQAAPAPPTALQIPLDE